MNHTQASAESSLLPESSIHSTAGMLRLSSSVPTSQQPPSIWPMTCASCLCPLDWGPLGAEIVSWLGQRDAWTVFTEWVSEQMWLLSGFLLSAKQRSYWRKEFPEGFLGLCITWRFCSFWKYKNVPSCLQETPGLVASLREQTSRRTDKQRIREDALGSEEEGEVMRESVQVGCRGCQPGCPWARKGWGGDREGRVTSGTPHSFPQDNSLYLKWA